MIEIHAHIIPGVDDGPHNIEEAMTLVYQAHKKGVTQIIATPHYVPDDIAVNTIIDQYNLLIQNINKNNIPINIHLGHEVHISENVISSLQEGKILTLANTNYVLLELPYHKIYPAILDQIYQLQRKGYQIVLAHVERYDYLLKDQAKLLKNLVKIGCYTQVNANSIVTSFNRCKPLFNQGLVHFVSSDAHHASNRPFCMDKAIQVLNKHYQTQDVIAWTHDRALALINQRSVDHKLQPPQVKSIFRKLFNVS